MPFFLAIRWPWCGHSSSRNPACPASGSGEALATSFPFRLFGGSSLLEGILRRMSRRLMCSAKALGTLPGREMLLGLWLAKPLRHDA